ncbi:TauD/TfdA dioxygenase family protein [Ramlibacter sp.]|uniref:TauD/TfdA dioxygenase family protein n=1 Tax=Ramlibacter sp. TaxID=1917967 RepID=UPI003D1129D6
MTTLTVTPIQPSFGATVEDVRLGDELDDAVVESIRQALDRHLVLVFPGQHDFSGEQQVRFAAHFGPLDVSAMKTLSKDLGRPMANQSYGEVSNVDAEGKIWSSQSRRRLFLMANQLWHTDTSYKEIPTRVTFLWAREVTPTGGETEFADMCAAWEALPAERQRSLIGLRAVHSLFHSRGLVGFTDFSDEERAAFPPVAHPLVRKHASGRTALYLSSHASHIEGMPYEEGSRLLQELTEHATKERFVLSHTWRQGDLVIWDDSATLHRGRPYDEFKDRRVLQRTSANEAQPLRAAAMAELG